MLSEALAQIVALGSTCNSAQNELPNEFSCAAGTKTIEKYTRGIVNLNNEVAQHTPHLLYKYPVKYLAYNLYVMPLQLFASSTTLATIKKAFDRRWH